MRDTPRVREPYGSKLDEVVSEALRTLKAEWHRREGIPTLPPHEPDYGRTGHPKHWCERCRIEAASV